MANTPTHRSFRDASQQMVHFEVDESKQRFTIHAQFVRDRCPGLTVLLAEQAHNHHDEKILVFPEITSRVFSFFMDWLYFGTLPELTRTDEDQECGNCGETHDAMPKEALPKLLKPLTAEMHECIDPFMTWYAKNSSTIALYTFAVENDIPTLREDIVNLWFQHLDTGVPYFRAIVRLGKNDLAKYTPLYNLLADSLIHDMRPKHHLMCPIELLMGQKLPPDLLYRMVLRDQLKSKMDICTYHEHAQDDETIAACKSRVTMEKKRKRDQTEDEVGDEGRNRGGRALRSST